MLMDNGQNLSTPQVQSMPPVQPVQPVQGGSVVQPAQAEIKDEKDKSGLIKTIVIVIVSLIAVTFIGLFVWMYMQYSDAKEDVDGQISVAVAKAKDEQAAELESEFSEREKDPYSTFSGPADYGELTFKYPRTWSVYVSADASNGGDFNAYLNPVQVEPISNSTVNALRVTINNKSFDSVVAEYQRSVERKDSNLTVESVTIGDAENGTSTTANRYSGTIPNTDLNGFIVIFKIRDKTVILQTDSVLFEGDFNRLLTTIRFNS